MIKRISLPTDISIIIAYRRQVCCKMYNFWQHPADIKKEKQAKELEVFPKLKFVNLTVGEPFQSIY